MSKEYLFKCMRIYKIKLNNSYFGEGEVATERRHMLRLLDDNLELFLEMIPEYREFK